MGQSASSSRWKYQDEVLTIAACGVAWTGVYFLIRKKIFPRNSADFSNRMTSLVHAVVMLPLSAAALDYRHPFSSFGGITTAYQREILCVTMGYFIYDTIGVYLIEHDVTNTLHHLCTMLGLGVGIFQQRSGSELTCCLFLMEVSNPFLHLRTAFKELGKKDSFAAEMNNALFAATFVGCRLIAGPFVVYYTLKSRSTSPIVKAGGVGIQIVSIFWFVQIVKIAMYKTGFNRPPAKPKATLGPKEA